MLVTIVVLSENPVVFRNSDESGVAVADLDGAGCKKDFLTVSKYYLSHLQSWISYVCIFLDSLCT